MDAYVRHDVMANTLRARFLGSRRIQTRGAVITVMKELVDVKQKAAIYKCGDGGEWYITLKDRHLAETLGDGGMRDLGKNLSVLLDRIDRKVVKFRVHWFPLHIQKELVAEFMARYGADVTVEEETMEYDGVRLATGTLSGKMVCTEAQSISIPYRTRIYRRQVLITVLGRPSQCLRCGDVGHQRSSCPEREDRRRSYADTARGDHERDAGRNGEGREAEGPRSRSSEGTLEGAEVLTSSEGTNQGAEVLTTGSEGTDQGTEVLGHSSEGATQRAEVLVRAALGEDTRMSVDVPAPCSSEGTHPSVEVLKRSRDDDDDDELQLDAEETTEKKIRGDDSGGEVDMKPLMLPLVKPNDPGDPVEIV